jgi:hypothetical protein
MANNRDIVKEERELLAQLPFLVGSYILSSEGEADTSACFEFEPIFHIIAESDEMYEKNRFVRMFLDRDNSSPIKACPLKIDKQENCFDTPLECCKIADKILRETASPREHDEYKQFLLAIAMKIAKATGSAVFNSRDLGKKITDGEADAFLQIAAALSATQFL